MLSKIRSNDDENQRQNASGNMEQLEYNSDNMSGENNHKSLGIGGVYYYYIINLNAIVKNKIKIINNLIIYELIVNFD